MDLKSLHKKLHNTSLISDLAKAKQQDTNMRKSLSMFASVFSSMRNKASRSLWGAIHQKKCLQIQGQNKILFRRVYSYFMEKKCYLRVWLGY